MSAFGTILLPHIEVHIGISLLRKLHGTQWPRGGLQFPFPIKCSTLWASLTFRVFYPDVIIPLWLRGFILYKEKIRGGRRNRYEENLI